MLTVSISIQCELEPTVPDEDKQYAAITKPPSFLSTIKTPFRR